MIGNRIPNAFVWTKMQADAGEDIGGIRRRKELERQAGNGTFWWGIGESRSAAIGHLREVQPAPEVLFSLMLSAPRAPSGGVLLWQAYKVTHGEVTLPPHVIVTSSALDRSGNPKRRYYALVCRSRSSILRNGGGTLNAATLRNIGEYGKPVAKSRQVTFVVETCQESSATKEYPITARARLVAPYAVALAAPRELSRNEQRLLVDVGTDSDVDDWVAVAKRLRRL